jgi:acetyl esterase/lipase
MGWNVVNVGYRLLRVAGAPAAVEDAQCALRYIARRRPSSSTSTRRDRRR